MSCIITLAWVLVAAASLSAQTPAPPPRAAIPPAAAPAASPQAKPLPDSTQVVLKTRFPVNYSPAAEEKKLHGTVVLSVLFNEAGAEESAEITGGDPDLARCALESIPKWQ